MKCNKHGIYFSFASSWNLNTQLSTCGIEEAVWATVGRASTGYDRFVA